MFMTYDSNASKSIIFGGTNFEYGGTGGIYFNTTFLYDYSDNKWLKMNCSKGPSARYLSGLAFNSKLNHTLLHSGGQGDYGVDDDTWIFTYDECCNCFPENPECYANGNDFGTIVFASTLILLSCFMLIVKRRKKN
jgi:hypothetical protein